MKLSPIALAALVVLAAILVAPAARADSVQELWNKKCAVCHGQDGKGNTKMGKKKGVKDLTDPAVRAKFERSRMIKSVTEGIQEKDGSGYLMKGYGDKLSSEEIAALVDYAINLGQ